MDGVKVSVASAAVGPVTLSDIQHAAAIGARVLAFGVRTGGPPIEREAKRLGVPVAGERVIYRLLDSVAGWVAGAAPRVGKEVVVGKADVLQVFTSGGTGAAVTAVAGVRVGEGALAKGETLRVLRKGATIHEGACTSLRRHKLDVARVGRGTECGVVLEGFSDFQPGDVLVCVVMEYVTPSAEDVLAKANGGGG
jgi:translation initiation factor IF-2